MTALSQSIYYSLMFSSIVDHVVSCLMCVPIMYVTKMLLLYTDSMFFYEMCSRLACINPQHRINSLSCKTHLLREDPLHLWATPTGGESHI